jgi:hypothetical protein
VRGEEADQQPEQAAGEEPGQHQHRQHQQQRAPHQPCHQLTPAEYQGYMGSNSRVYHSSQSRLPERNQGSISTVNISSSGPHNNHAISLRLQNTRDTWAPILEYTTAARAGCRRGTRATPAPSTSAAAAPITIMPSAYACRLPGIHGLQF